MNKKYLSTFFGLVLLVVVGCSQSVSAAEPQYYLAEWHWNDGENNDGLAHWESPFPLETTGTIDLRNLVQMAQSGGQDQCCLLLQMESIKTSTPKLIYLGTEYDAVISNINLVEAMLKHGSFTSPTISGIVRELFTDKSDPLGQTAPKPIIPNHNRVIVADIGGVRLFTDKISTGSIAWEKAVRVLQDDYDIAKSRNLTHALKIAGYWKSKYGFDIRSAVQKLDGILEPETIIGDTFLVGSDTAIGSHTATGPNGGFGWTVLENGITVFAATDDINGDSTANANTARADSDLSSTDHYVQGVAVTVPIGGDDFGVLGRKDGTGTMTFYLARWTTNPKYELYKVIAGTFTQLDPDVVETMIDDDVLKLEMNGTTIRLLENDVEKVSVTDSSISTGFRTGLRLYKESAQVDDFEAADLAVPGVRRIFTFSY